MAETTTYPDQQAILDKEVTASRPAYIEINLDAFANNVKLVRNLIGEKISMMAVVKANAYGHGLVAMAKAAECCGADLLGVAMVEEGVRLLESGIRAPLVVLYPDLPERAMLLAKAGLIATVSSEEYLIALNEAGKTLNKKVKIFLKIETGMGRYGLAKNEIEPIISLAKTSPFIDIIGLSTNLANSANGQSKLNEKQFAEFDTILRDAGLNNPLMYRAIENSGGVLYHHHIQFNLVRVGIILYGISPNGKLPDGFKPIMSLKSRIIQTKKWPAGQPIGYGSDFTTQRKSVIATIPIGYADGYSWSLSNKSCVLIHGKRAPIVGKICMDAMMIDITDIPDVKTGDEAVLLGRQGNETIKVEELAVPAGSFPYEFVTRLSDRLPRVFIGG